jgi:non-ribosomal peptide synthetase component E (peptide arylation enzyme)
MMEHFDSEEAFRLIERERISIASVVPAQLTMMLDHPNLGQYDLSSWKCAFSSGAPLSYPNALRLEERTRCRIINGYGAQELPGISTTSISDPREVRLLTVGKPYSGVEIKIVGDAGNELKQGEIGKIVVRGPFASAGYYKSPDHPKIERVAVVGMPDRTMGQKCCAFVVPRRGEVLTFDEVISFLKNKRIAPYKLPERLKIIDVLPYTNEQKIDRKVLRAKVAEELERGADHIEQ